MVRIINHCYTNLNQKSVADEILGEDVTTELFLDTSPTILLASVNLNRKIVKIFTFEYSDKSAQLWVHHSTGVNSFNASFALPENKLYVDSFQASRPLSIMLSAGNASVKFTVVNKI